MPSIATPYKRLMLKVSGEALMGPEAGGIHAATLARVASDIAEARTGGLELCLVVGGGNIFRGLAGAARGIVIAWIVTIPASAVIAAIGYWLSSFVL